MGFIMLVGFLAIIFAIIYLIVHYVKRIKDKERELSKKVFYPALFGGFILFAIGVTFLDTGIQEDLDEAIAENEALKAEITDLQKQISDLETTNTENEAKIA